MKKLLFVFVLLSASISFAQSPSAFRQLNLKGTRNYSLAEPEEYNWWAGARVAYPVYGDPESFDLTFGVQGKLVRDFIKLDFARTWYILLYGNLGLPNYNSLSVFNMVASADEGISAGVQAYTVFGNLSKNAFTFYLNSLGKLNNVAGSRLYSYRFGAGGEVSISSGKAPIVLNISPAYVLLADDTRFARVQDELQSNGFWTSDAFLILPVGEKLGLLAQITVAEKVSPVYRIGVVLAAGL